MKQFSKTCYFQPILVMLVFFSLSIDTALADGIAKLEAFYANTKAMTADFHQLVTDSEGQKVQEVEGKMLIQRPNRFRWDYAQPFEQEIVSDGEYVYLYDVELEQVTVNPVTKTLGASPAALLSGDDSLYANFDMQAISKNDDLDWVQVTPKQNDTGFNQIALAFNQQGDLDTMVLVDSFGQQTAITFSAQNNQADIPADTFKFVAPDGVDVLGQ